MTTLDTMLITVGILMLLEAATVLLYPKLLKKLIAKKTALKKAAIAELVVGILLILIAYF